MLDVLLVALQLALNVTLPAWIVRRDLKRLTREQLGSAWNTASFWSAVVGFGPLCLPVHFCKVRRSAKGLLLGFTWMLVAILANASVQLALGFAVAQAP